MVKKDIIVVTGGAGFVGTNLIKLLLKKTSYKVISLDDYSTGRFKNHIVNKRVKYLNSSTTIISKTLKKYKKKNTFFISLWRIFKNIPKFFKNE